MNIIKIAAFSDHDLGGNLAGVAIASALPPVQEMQRIAAEIGFSETVFAAQQQDGQHWRIRYFSPESEVPFCGHATIALGAALAQAYGDGHYHLELNENLISVESKYSQNGGSAALQSPPTHHQMLDDDRVNETLALFGYTKQQLSDQINPARIYAGADHYVLALRSREDLANMNYDLDAGRDFMQAHGLVTVMLVVQESDELFHARNAFASGGVLEDPATGAAAAAFAAYLRDIRSSAGKIRIIQGEDMGARSLITAEFSAVKASSVRVSGTTRTIR